MQDRKTSRFRLSPAQLLLAGVLIPALIVSLLLALSSLKTSPEKVPVEPEAALPPAWVDARPGGSGEKEKQGGSSLPKMAEPRGHDPLKNDPAVGICLDCEAFAEGFVDEERAPRALNLPKLQQEIGYPPEAKDVLMDGKVVFRVLVDEVGQYVRHQIVYRSHRFFAEHVEPFLDDIIFSPGIQAGQPVRVWVNVPFNFKLKR